MRLPILALLFASFLLSEARAQIQVDLEFPRRVYLVYEPILAKVTVRNLSGRDLILRDEGPYNWFGFEITTEGGSIISPTDTNYHLEPLTLAAGSEVVRKVNITPLYEVREFGQHRVKANIFSAELGRHFSSRLRQFEITDGKPIWQQSVGVPRGMKGEGGTRKLTLLTHRTADDSRLYARVEDPESGVVFATYQLGRIVSFNQPKAELDANNQLHILQLSGPRTYTYTHLGLEGEVIERASYETTKSAPHLKRSPEGIVEIAGGRIILPASAMANANAPVVPKLSERPVPVVVPKMSGQ